ncbi:hypothetical protein ACOME3_005771 [Neoechinorhynchus agilis]
MEVDNLESSDAIKKLVEQMLSSKTSGHFASLVRRLAAFCDTTNLDKLSLDVDRKSLKILIAKIIGMVQSGKHAGYYSLTKDEIMGAIFIMSIDTNVIDIYSDTNIHSWFFEEIKILISANLSGKQTALELCLKITFNILKNNHKNQMHVTSLAFAIGMDCIRSLSWPMLNRGNKLRIIALYASSIRIGRAFLVYSPLSITVLDLPLSEDDTTISSLAAETGFLILTYSAHQSEAKEMIEHFMGALELKLPGDIDALVEYLAGFVHSVQIDILAELLGNQRFLRLILRIVNRHSNSKILNELINVVVMLAEGNAEFKKIVLSTSFLELFMNKFTQSHNSVKHFDDFTRSFLDRQTNSFCQPNAFLVAQLLSHQDHLSGHLLEVVAKNLIILNNVDFLSEYRSNTIVVPYLCKLLTTAPDKLSDDFFKILENQLAYSCSPDDLYSIICALKQMIDSSAQLSVIIAVLDVISNAQKTTSADNQTSTHEIGLYKDDSAIVIGPSTIKSDFNTLSCSIVFTLETENTYFKPRQLISMQSRGTDCITAIIDPNLKYLTVMCSCGGSQHSTRLSLNTHSRQRHRLIVIYNYNVGLLKSTSRLYCRLDDLSETLKWLGGAYLNIRNGLWHIIIGYKPELDSLDKSSISLFGSISSCIITTKSWINIYKKTHQNSHNVQNVCTDETLAPADFDNECFLCIDGKGQSNGQLLDLSGKSTMITCYNTTVFSRTNIGISICALGGYRIFYPILAATLNASRTEVTQVTLKLVELVCTIASSRSNSIMQYLTSKKSFIGFQGLLIEMSKLPFDDQVVAIIKSITGGLISSELFRAFKELMFLLHGDIPMWNNASMEQKTRHLKYLKNIVPELYNATVQKFSFAECCRFLELCVGKFGRSDDSTHDINAIQSERCEIARYIFDIKLGISTSEPSLEFVEYMIRIFDDCQIFECALDATLNFLNKSNDAVVPKTFEPELTILLTKAYVEFLTNDEVFHKCLKLVTACLARLNTANNRSLSNDDFFQSFLASLIGKVALLSHDSLESLSDMIISYLNCDAQSNQGHNTVFFAYLVLLRELKIDSRISGLNKILELTFQKSSMCITFLSDPLFKNTYVPLLYKSKFILLDDLQMIGVRNRSLVPQPQIHEDQLPARNNTTEEIEEAYLLDAWILLFSFIIYEAAIEWNQSGRCNTNQWMEIKSIMTEIRFFDKVANEAKSVKVIEKISLYLLTVLSDLLRKGDCKLGQEYIVNTLDLVSECVFEETATDEFIKRASEYFLSEELLPVIENLWINDLDGQNDQAQLTLIIILAKYIENGLNIEKEKQILLVLRHVSGRINEPQLAFMLYSTMQANSKGFELVEIRSILLAALKATNYDREGIVEEKLDEFIKKYMGNHFIGKLTSTSAQFNEIQEDNLRRYCKRTRFQLTSRLYSMMDSFKNFIAVKYNLLKTTEMQRKSRMFAEVRSNVYQTGNIFQNVIQEQSRTIWRFQSVIQKNKESERWAIIDRECGCHMRCNLKQENKSKFDSIVDKHYMTALSHRKYLMAKYPHLLELNDDDSVMSEGSTKDSFILLEDQSTSTTDKRNAVSYNCIQVTIMTEIPGKLSLPELSELQLIFQPSTKNFKSVVIDIELIRYMIPRRYKLKNSAVEFYLTSQQSFYFNLDSAENRTELLQKLYRLRPPKLQKIWSLSPRDILKSLNITSRWQSGNMSNFDYLMFLNILSGRSFNTLSQYPVFPWILRDYESSKLDLNDPKIYRDLAKPIGIQSEVRESFISQRLKCNENASPDESFHYGTHYSTPAMVIHYLIRLEPFTSLHLALQDGRFDFANRLFRSIQLSWASVTNTSSDVSELTPEFFYLSEMLRNSNGLKLGRLQDTNKLIDNVELPPWASNDFEKFIFLHRPVFIYH